MDLHAVLLAKGKTGDGTLSAATVSKVKLQSTRLTVLSVCNGGLYRIGPADSPFGLIPAFIEAGSQNVLGKAYQKTALRFIGEDEFIRRWAAFVLVGPGRPFAPPSK